VSATPTPSPQSEHHLSETHHFTQLTLHGAPYAKAAHGFVPECRLDATREAKL